MQHTQRASRDGRCLSSQEVVTAPSDCHSCAFGTRDCHFLSSVWSYTRSRMKHTSRGLDAFRHLLFLALLIHAGGGEGAPRKKMGGGGRNASREDFGVKTMSEPDRGRAGSRGGECASRERARAAARRGAFSAASRAAFSALTIRARPSFSAGPGACRTLLASAARGEVRGRQG